MQWITENILGMGGMQACDFTLEKTPNEGLQQILALNKKDNLYNSIMLPLSLTGCAPFTTGPFTTRIVVKGSVIIIIIIMIVIIVFGICIRFFLSISWWCTRKSTVRPTWWTTR